MNMFFGFSYRLDKFENKVQPPSDFFLNSISNKLGACLNNLPWWIITHQHQLQKKFGLSKVLNEVQSLTLAYIIVGRRGIFFLSSSDIAFLPKFSCIFWILKDSLLDKNSVGLGHCWILSYVLLLLYNIWISRQIHKTAAPVVGYIVNRINEVQ